MKVDSATLVERARTYMSTTPRPFIKWAGSKRWLLPRMVEVLPPTFGTYWEPFLGSGALFFLLAPARAHLNDKSPELVEAFAAVRDNPRAVLRYLDQMKIGKAEYYRVRKKRSHGRLKRAAEFIYLNRLCWNGLYRVNADGEFNVPYGKPRSDFLVDRDNLRACTQALARRSVRMSVGDFETSLDGVRSGDLVYLDPPYVTSHNNNGFVEYNQALFGWDDQVRLASVARDLVRAGAHVLVTNAHHDAVRRLYPRFDAITVARMSTLANDTQRRTRTREVILVG